MSRKRCHRNPVALQVPPGLRPKLNAEQLRGLALVHLVNLDTIARGEAEPSMLWDVAGGVLTWSRAAQLAGQGVPEMARQMEMVERLIDRFRRTKRVLFDGPDYQIAKDGVAVMDALASTVDLGVAEAAARWSEAQIRHIATELTLAEGA